MGAQHIRDGILSWTRGKTERTRSLGEMGMRVLLTDRFCDRAKSSGAQTDYFDENVSGLALRVTAGGVKTWTLHYGPAKKCARIGLGRYPSTSLASARALALEAKSAVADGRDPRSGPTDAMTVTGLVESYVEKHTSTLRSADEIKRRVPQHRARYRQCKALRTPSP
jgi:hypothetical protein